MKQLFNFITETGMKDPIADNYFSGLVAYFYFLLVFFCAIDDQCAAIYMEVAHANS